MLDEARDESVPLFERLKFAAIFTSNLDEFFMIRVGSIYDMSLSRQTHVDSKSGLTPAEQLQAICKTVPGMCKQPGQDDRASWNPGCAAADIWDVSWRSWTGRSANRWSAGFRSYVQPVLSPMVIDITTPSRTCRPRA